MGLFSGPGVNPSLKGLASNVLALAPGQTQVIAPAGWYMSRLGPYTVLQTFDPVANFWRSVGDGSTGATSEYFYSDGNNYRFANLTGAPVGALLTTAGSGYVTAPTITVSAGGSQWRAILGGAISTTISIVNAGVGYTYAPTVVIAAPPPNGIQATATCTISAGIVNTITVTNQGAGYTTPPIITFLNDYRETLNATNNITLGYNAAAIATLTGSGTVTGVLCTDHGQGGLTVLPTLTFSSGAAVATVLMNWTVTGYAVTTAGAGVSGTLARITAEDNIPTTATAYVNPYTQGGLVKIRSADIRAVVTAGAITAGGTLLDGGIYTSVPVPLIIPNASVLTVAPAVTLTVGGIADTVLYTPV